MAMTIDPMMTTMAALPESDESFDFDDSAFAEAIRQGRQEEKRDAYASLRDLS